MVIDPLTFPLVLSKKHLKLLADLSPAAVDAMDKAGQMPRSFKPSHRRRRWHRQAILDWIAAGMPDLRMQSVQKPAASA